MQLTPKNSPAAQTFAEFAGDGAVEDVRKAEVVEPRAQEKWPPAAVPGVRLPDLGPERTRPPQSAPARAIARLRQRSGLRWGLEVPMEWWPQGSGDFGFLGNLNRHSGGGRCAGRRRNDLLSPLEGPHESDHVLDVCMGKGKLILHGQHERELDPVDHRVLPLEDRVLQLGVLGARLATWRR